LIRVDEPIEVQHHDEPVAFLPDADDVIGAPV